MEKRVLIAADSLLYKTKDNKYWSDTIYSYSFFERYLSVFDDVIIVSRCKYASYEEVSGFLRSDGNRVQIRELPAMQGMSAYIKNFLSFAKKAKAACENVDCAIIRLPSVPASMVWHFFRKKRLPIALEIVADPYDAYASNKIAQRLFTRIMKRACITANGVSYVTERYLQKKYPSYSIVHGEDSSHFSASYSTIMLNGDYFYQARRYVENQTIRIIHTANSMNSTVKGQDILIKAAKVLRDKHYPIEVVFVGDGQLRNEYEQLSMNLGISDITTFTGLFSKPEDVRSALIDADMFVLPTKAEGLPRSIIEAMAVGLPCISTPIAGVPELLETNDLIDPDDYEGFANRIAYFIDNPDVMSEKSSRNINFARKFENTVLKEKRDSFYHQLKSLTKERGY